MRILHIIAPAPTGGAESVVTNLARGQREANLDARVLASITPADPEPHPFLAGLARLEVPHVVARVGARSVIEERRQFRAAVAAFRPDVIHSHGYRTDLLLLRTVRHGAATASTFHGFTGGSRKLSVYEFLQCRAARRVGAAIAVSRGIEERLRAAGVPPSRIRLIPNAVAPSDTTLSREDARALLRIPPEGLVVGWIGRLSREKGPDTMLDAAPHLLAGSTVAILGDGPMREDLTRRLAYTGATQVHLYGEVPSARRLMAAFDILALSSRTEGTPMVLLEAMQAGVPIVASSVGGVPALVGETAILVPPESPTGLATGCNALLRDAQRRQQLAEAARKRALQDFSVSRWVSAHAEAYELALREA